MTLIQIHSTETPVVVSVNKQYVPFHQLGKAKQDVILRMIATANIDRSPIKRRK